MSRIDKYGARRKEVLDDVPVGEAPGYDGPPVPDGTGIIIRTAKGNYDSSRLDELDGLGVTADDFQDIVVDRNGVSLVLHVRDMARRGLTALSEIHAPLVAYKPVSNGDAIFDFNGGYNTRVCADYLASEGDEDNAFSYCLNLGCYVPSAGQMYAIRLLKSKIHQIASHFGFTLLPVSDYVKG